MKRALRAMGALTLALIALMVGACALSDSDSALARRPMAALQARDMTALYDMLSPGLRNEETRATLETIMAMTPETAPARIRTVSWRVTMTADGRALDTLQLYEYADRMLEVRTLMVEGEGGAELAALTVTPIDAAAIEANELRFDRMSGLHIAMLAGAIASVGLMIGALIAVLRTRGLAMKWLWGIIAFVGVGTVWLNWTAGQAGFHPASINVIGVGLSRAASPLSPWFLHFTVPVGAIAVLAIAYQHRRRRDSAATQGSD